ncbi:hypothetical protein [Psychroflexus sediminis]|uniref:Uncharacterized protein n=1 Tax=Psychroflexus sediminis TaxID=470826 RepID=A0A1G7V9S9_9FLAO|nr:hypothetical protein [Psychroflexus sediminis]SDG55710.1 hypothetical protein SAMN04488027_103130 [Psychroflexus sediminis]
MIGKILNTQNINYSSNLNGDNLKQKIQDIFEKNHLSFVGKFTSQSRFSAADKWTYIKWYVPNFKRKTAYLNGEIIKTGKGTLIKLNLKPNPVVSIFPALTILIGLILIIVAEVNKDNATTLNFGLILIAVGISFYLFGMFLRNRLLNNFKKNLDLQKV